MHKPFGVSVKSIGFSGVFYIKKTKISYAPPIADKWVGKKWSTFVKHMFKVDEAFDFNVI